MNAPHPPTPGDRPQGGHPDLDRLLAALPSDEAERLREVWALAGAAEPAVAPDPEADLRTERLLAALATSNGRAAPPTRAQPLRLDRAALPARRPMSTPWRVARWTASLAGVAVVAALVWAQTPVVVEAPQGRRVAVALPDGSTVTLNSGTTLRRDRAFDRLFGGARRVELVGEAFFDVAEERTPFTVRTFDAEVTVLGTRFGVRAWPDEPEPATTVALVSGRIRLSATAAPSAPLILGPGEVGRIPAGARPVAERGGVEDALAWRGGDLVYKDRPLAVILADVERRFGAVVSPAPAALGRRRVSVALRAPASAEAVVRDLATALGLRYRARADGFELAELAEPAVEL